MCAEASKPKAFPGDSSCQAELSWDAPGSLEVFQVRLDRAWSNQV